MSSGGRATGSKRSADFGDDEHHGDHKHTTKRGKGTEAQDPLFLNPTADGELDEAAMFAAINARLAELSDDSEEDGGDEDDDDKENGSDEENGSDGSQSTLVGMQSAGAAADEQATETAPTNAAPVVFEGRRPLTKAEKKKVKLAEFKTNEERAVYLADQKAKKVELKKNGFTVGKVAPALVPETYQYERDEPIPEGDPYHGKCERRMEFTSAPVPLDMQYQRPDGDTQDRPYPSNAVDKFLNWCESRPTSNGKWLKDPQGKEMVDENGYCIQNPKWDEEGYNNGRLSRHFILKVGPPNGSYGQPGRLADRLNTMNTSYLRSRLRTSHVTIETAIPYSKQWTGTAYFEQYMDTLLKLKEKLGERLTIELDHASTERLMSAKKDEFHPAPLTTEQLEEMWRLGLMQMKNDKEYAHYIRSMVDADYIFATRGLPRVDLRQVESPSRAMINEAKALFFKQQKDLHADKEIAAGKALSSTKIFIRDILELERPKSSGTAAVPLEIDESDVEVMDVNAGQQAYGLEAAVPTMWLPAPDIDMFEIIRENNVDVRNTADAAAAGLDAIGVHQAQPYTDESQTTIDLELVSEGGAYSASEDGQILSADESSSSASQGSAQPSLGPDIDADMLGALKEAQELTHRAHTHRESNESAKETFWAFASALFKDADMHLRAQERAPAQRGEPTVSDQDARSLPNDATPVLAPVAAPSPTTRATSPDSDSDSDSTAQFGGTSDDMLNEEQLKEVKYWAVVDADIEVYYIHRRDFEARQLRGPEHYEMLFDQMKAAQIVKLSERYIEHLRRKAQQQQQEQQPSLAWAPASPGAAQMPVPQRSIHNPYLSPYFTQQ